MRIICEYCKNTIDTDKDSKCPNCNASYHDNKEFKERLKKLKEEKDIELETRKLQNETFKTVLGHTNRVFNSSKYIFIFVGIFIMAIMILIGSSVFKQTSKKVERLDNKPKEVEVEVNFEQYAETSEYKVMVDKVVDVKKLYDVLSPSEGKEYKAFHFIVQNKTEKSLLLPFHINCIVDDFAQKQVYYLSKYPGLPSYIDKGLKGEGYALFEVPKETKKFDIRYGDYVTIHINEE